MKAAFLLPKATRERDVFGIVCSLVTGLVALIGVLQLGERVDRHGRERRAWIRFMPA